MKIEFLMNVRQQYDCHIASSILSHVSGFNVTNKYWGPTPGENTFGLLTRNIKEDLSRKKKQAVVAPIDVFEFEVVGNTLNIWHLKYNKDRDYLVSTIINE